MNEYTRPMVELISFGNERVSTSNSGCDCYAERWNYAENWDFTAGGCELTTGGYMELADANSGL